MHDKPGILKFNVNSQTFDADVSGALSDGYDVLAALGEWLIMAWGYKK